MLSKNSGFHINNNNKIFYNIVNRESGKTLPSVPYVALLLKVKDLRSCVRQEIRMLRRSARIYIECIFAFNSVRSRINLDLLGQQLFSYCLFYYKCLLFPFNIMIPSKC